MLSTLLLLITIYGILQANQDSLPPEIKNLVRFKILDPSATAGLFVTAVGALLVRHQYGVSSRPRINYKSALATKTNPLNPAELFEVLRVEIRNNGLGAAIVNRIDFELELLEPKENIYVGSHNVVIKQLEKIGLIRNRDYWLENITTGFALPDKESLLMFELKSEHIQLINRLDMMLYFQGQIGDKYCREIFLLPRKSI